VSTASLAAAGLRGHARRLVATAAAVALSVAFVATAMLGLDAMERGAREAVAGDVVLRDLVVWPGEGALDSAAVESLRGLDGVEVVEASAQVYGTVDGVSTVATTAPRGSGVELLEGRMPSTSRQAVAGSDTGYAVGDTVPFALYGEDGSPGAPIDLEIVGVMDVGDAPQFAWEDPLVVPESALVEWEPELGFSMVSLDLDGASAAEAGTLIATAAPGTTVMTGEEAGQLMLERSMGGMDLLGALLLGFAAVAVVTSAMVIANTFAIVLAQRTRELALLRCVGATRSQVRRTVLTEALALGVVAATAGVLLGIAVVRIAAVVVNRLDLGAELTLRPGWPLDALLVPWLVGLLVTVGAAWWPTRRATRVAPLAALQPANAPVAATRPGLLRIAVSVLLLGAGAAGLVLAVSTHDVLIGVAAGLVSFGGVLVAAVFLVPAGIRALGALLPGVPARLAVGTTVSNPARAAATSAALLIGVTLITMTSVGAATAARTAEAEIDARYPADVMVLPGFSWEEPATDAEEGPSPMDIQGVTPSAAGRVAGLEGVAVAAPLPAAFVTISAGEDWWTETPVYGIDEATNGAALRSPRTVEALTPGTIGLGSDQLGYSGLEPGDVVTVTGQTGSRELTVVEVEASDFLLPMADLLRVDASASDHAGLLVRLSDDADVGAAVADIEDAVQDEDVWVTGGAAERALLDQVLNVLVLVTTGLLGVAVIIAVVGIANTLALSVLERSRENSLLRALGLTRSQLRRMLTVEGLLLSVVSAVLGIALGVTYAWFGVRTLMPGGTETLLAFPVTRLVVILGVAIVAGLLASVLPARRAAMTAPAAGLAAV